MQLLKKIKEKANKLKTELVVLHLAYQHSETPWIPKALIVLIIGYALSPIDLIPDFIPIIGLLDDLILLPLGIYWTIQLIPKKIITASRIKAITYTWDNDKNLKAGFIIVMVWCVILCFTISKFI